MTRIAKPFPRPRPNAPAGDASGSDATRSDTTHSDESHRDETDSDAAQSDAVQSDAVQSDAVQSDAVQSDAVQSDAVQSDAVQSDEPFAGRVDRDVYPSYSEHQWERRVIRRPTRPLPEAVSGLPDVVMDYLVESSLADTLDALALSPLERAMAEMRLGGASVREIAAGTGLKKWHVERALAVVRRRLIAARHAALPNAPSGPVRHAAGWQEVYLAETRRRGKK